MCGRDMKQFVDSECRNGRDQTGDKAGIIKNSNTDKLQCKYRRCDRRSEQGRKDCRHAAQCCKTKVFIVQVEERSYICANTSTDLERSTFATGRSATNVGNQGGNKDAGRQQDRSPGAFPNGINYGIGVLVFHFGHRIHQSNERPACRQEPDQPWIHFPKSGGIPDRQIKDASNDSADETGEQCDQDPFEKRPDQLFY